MPKYLEKQLLSRADKKKKSRLKRRGPYRKSSLAGIRWRKRKQ